ncbi:MAG: hypothetical protein AAFR61_17605 [Bacteroidota bacterium]
MNAKLNKNIFLGFLLLNTVMGLFFGFLPLVDFPLVLEMNQIPYSQNLLIFGVVSGTAMLFLGSMFILSFYWTRKDKWEGSITGMIGGGYLLLVGILSWLYTGDPTAFLMDSIRGFLTIFFGYYLYRSLKNL